MLQMNEGDAVAVIVAAGQGSRMGANHNKLLLQLGKRTILETSLEPFLLHPRIRKIFLATAPQDQQKINKFISEEVVLVKGGKRRQDSVHNALQELMRENPIPEVVLIHDGARPFCNANLIDRILDSAWKDDAAMPVLPIMDTIRHISEQKSNVVNRRALFAVQTPQGFRTKLIYDASLQAQQNNWEVTDDASLLEKCGKKVSSVEGIPHNLKITTPADLEQAKGILKSMNLS
ncbi:MAG: 2-C-methyl-D-erythritol 4-phosphate cytidylyltransferase [Deltaproteobacteria bacterium]|jgi:2-C-methyl-D-erythritol 4-phosphate cytidylyltransferase|nr:2-C-methyl-D-erythritol 4-phosphate cytidylyltransferase [Deltaproteobacteria bacterium]